MKQVHGLRMMLTLFVAVLLPLELGHCTSMPLRGAAAIESAHHEGGDDDYCCGESESAPAHAPTSPADACCCGHIQLPAAPAPVAVSLNAPAPVILHFASLVIAAQDLHSQTAAVRFEPEERSGAPPDPATAQQSPRSPPYSA